MKTKRGILGLFLALCVVWSMLPLGAFAADENAGDEPKPISAIADLLRIDQNLSGNYILTNDIDLSIINWTPIGTEDESFIGTFDGNGHKITGLTIDNTDSEALGLFGYVDSGGTVKNLTVSGSVIDTGRCVGGVVGYNVAGTVENCCNTGEVSGGVEIVGGVVGFNESGTVKNCYNTGEVSGDVGFTGGVVGYNVAGTVENCYNTGKVSDDGSAGGVIGWIITGSGTVTNCCYLTDTADEGIGDGSYTGNGAQSLSAEDFADQASFKDWDFDSTWEMSALLGRPILQSNPETVHLDGSGTPASPYEIPDLATLERARDLMNVNTTAAATYRSASYVLTDDIEMSEKYGEGKKSWTPIGTYDTPFTGTFDGQDHSIGCISMRLILAIRAYLAI